MTDTFKIEIVTTNIVLEIGQRAVSEGGDFDGFSRITVGDTEPTSPTVGDLWVDTN